MSFLCFFSSHSPTLLPQIISFQPASIHLPRLFFVWGPGRIAQRLPKRNADDVVSALLTDGFELYEDANAWHGTPTSLPSFRSFVSCAEIEEMRVRTRAHAQHKADTLMWRVVSSFSGDLEPCSAFLYLPIFPLYLLFSAGFFVGIFPSTHPSSLLFYCYDLCFNPQGVVFVWRSLRGEVCCFPSGWRQPCPWRCRLFSTLC